MYEVKSDYMCDGFGDAMLNDYKKAKNKTEFFESEVWLGDINEAANELERMASCVLSFRASYVSTDHLGNHKLKIGYDDVRVDYDDLIMNDAVWITTNSIHVDLEVDVGVVRAYVQLSARLPEDIKQFLRNNGNMGPSMETYETIQCNV